MAGVLPVAVAVGGQFLDGSHFSLGCLEISRRAPPLLLILEGANPSSAATRRESLAKWTSKTNPKSIIVINSGRKLSLSMKIRPASKPRKAISPIIATVLIIAVTLIASVAIGGFVFGIFAQGQNSAQIAVTGTALVGVNFATTGTTTTFSCATSSSLSYLTLTNTGTGSAGVSTVSITWAGSNNAYSNSGTAASCNIGAAGATGGNPAVMYLIFPITSRVSSASAAPGQAYTGTVTLTNGAQLLFTGTWQ
jgi:flagellin-like protein